MTPAMPLKQWSCKFLTPVISLQGLVALDVSCPSLDSHAIAIDNVTPPLFVVKLDSLWQVFSLQLLRILFLEGLIFALAFYTCKQFFSTNSFFPRLVLFVSSLAFSPTAPSPLSLPGLPLCPSDLLVVLSLGLLIVLFLFSSTLQKDVKTAERFSSARTVEFFSFTRLGYSFIKLFR